ncbi:hypothetical protein [Symbioplanes lichenis]|uniref:pectate lyase family protein n=1 Tax=Symbioplanes lichenis TaxID=1629072 RepID=UPI002738E031|nr:hypothetical protein [Actinoplanes lichenis]
MGMISAARGRHRARRLAGVLAASANGLCVSNKDGSTAGNNPVVQETCATISRMQWSFTAVSAPGRWSHTADGFAQVTTDGASGTTVTFTDVNDGYIDSRIDTINVTVSWNKMGNHNKTFGIGWTTNVTARMTIHHNHIFNSTQRNPSADNLQYCHLYNNYLQNVTSYGNYARGATKMVIENGYFDKVNNPYYPDTATGAQLRQSGSTVVNSTGRQETSGSAFTPGSFYSYTLDPTANVPSLVSTSSGPRADIVM